MLIKKSGNSTETLIPLTTGYITDNEHSISAYSSFKMNMMCSPDKVVFPGENAAFAARYACFDTSSNEYISTKGTVSVEGGGGNMGGCGSTGDAYYLNDLPSWKNDFHRITNWRDYATYNTNETESANYIDTETSQATMYLDKTDYNEYIVQITDSFKTSTDDIPPSESAWWINSPTLTSEISFVLQDTIDDGSPDEWCYALAVNNVTSRNGTTSVSAYFTAHCENLKDWAYLHHTWPTWDEGTDFKLVFYNYRRCNHPAWSSANRCTYVCLLLWYYRRRYSSGSTCSHSGCSNSQGAAYEDGCECDKACHRCVYYSIHVRLQPSDAHARRKASWRNNDYHHSAYWYVWNQRCSGRLWS